MTQPMSKNATIASWIMRVVAAVIFLFPVGAISKLIGDPYAKELFTQLGAEPGGRYAVAIIELFTAVLLVIPRTAAYGAMLGALAMVGAIGSHLTKLGIVVEFTQAPDNGPEQNPMLFILAIVNLLLCLGVFALHRRQIPLPGSKPGPTMQSPD